MRIQFALLFLPLLAGCFEDGRQALNARDPDAAQSPQRMNSLHVGGDPAPPGQPANGNRQSVMVSGANATQARNGSVNTQTMNVQGNVGTATQRQSGSGNVDIHVPSSASFHLHAHSRSGNIATAIPLVVEEKTSKHELRARIGEGQGRVDVDTSSGDITLH